MKVEALRPALHYAPINKRLIEIEMFGVIETHSNALVPRFICFFILNVPYSLMSVNIPGVRTRSPPAARDTF